jgi:hypothetical protein
LKKLNAENEKDIQKLQHEAQQTKERMASLEEKEQQKQLRIDSLEQKNNKTSTKRNY